MSPDEFGRPFGDEIAIFGGPDYQRLKNLTSPQVKHPIRHAMLRWASLKETPTFSRRPKLPRPRCRLNTFMQILDRPRTVMRLTLSEVDIASFPITKTATRTSASLTQACGRSGVVGNFCNEMTPAPSRTTTSWSAAILETVSLFPLGQRISTSTLRALPRPKCSRRSLTDK